MRPSFILFILILISLGTANLIVHGAAITVLIFAPFLIGVAANFLLPGFRQGLATYIGNNPNGLLAPRYEILLLLASPLSVCLSMVVTEVAKPLQPFTPMIFIISFFLTVTIGREILKSQK